MSKTGTVVLYITTVLTMLYGAFFLTVPLTMWFTVRASAGWLVLPAFLIDGYFGAWYTLPLLTVVTVSWWIVSELVRPHIMWQNEVTDN